MSIPDPNSLINRVASGDASEEEIQLLGEMVARDSSLAAPLKEELEFSEWMRHALSDHSAQQSTDLRYAIDQQDWTSEEWIDLGRSGEMSPAMADELARRLLDSPEDAAKLRSGLMEDEWIAQIVSKEKQEDAFVESLVTRMWAETNEDHFVKDFTRKLDQIEKSDPSKVVPFPDASKPKLALIAGLAAAVAVTAFVLTLQWNGPTASPLATIVKATDDVVWADEARPDENGAFSRGTYRLESGAVSLAIADGKSLAVQGPALFEVDESGQAILHEGIALATSSLPDGVKEQDKFGVGLSARNVRFSEGAITVGLDARSSGSTEAIVFSGETGVCLTDAEKCRSVFEHEAIKADHDREKFVDIPYNPRAFSKAWELVSGVEKNIGDVVIELPGIDSSSRHSDSGELRVFVEKDRFQPAAPMEVDAIQPGYFASRENTTEGRSISSNGESMRSYLLQLWPSDQDDAEEMEASLTFDHPVVGVIFSSERLWNSDKEVGASTDHLVNASERGLDSRDDQILLSEDGRTLNLKLRGKGSEIDQVRVLVALK